MRLLELLEEYEYEGGVNHFSGIERNKSITDAEMLALETLGLSVDAFSHMLTTNGRDVLDALRAAEEATK